MEVRQTMKEYQVKAHSSALQVLYELTVGLNLKDPSKPGMVDIIAYYVRQDAIISTPAPALMEQCWDIGIVRKFLIDRGPLAEQPLKELVHSAILAARTFHGLRASDLFSMALLQQSPLDKPDPEFTRAIPFRFWCTKTAKAVNGASNLWVTMSIRPIRAAKIRKGLHLSPKAARDTMLSCCFVRAAHEIRKRLLPSMQQMAVAYTHKGVSVHALNFFPQVKQKITLTKKIRFYGRNSINPRIREMHHAMVKLDIGMPPLAEGQMARHYRHVALTTMHLVGCSDEAKTRHAKGSSEFERSYHIDDLNPEFALRFGAVEGITAFAQLYACERLLL